MAAGPVGSVWAAGTWTDVCWTADTWATALALLSFYRNDLTMAVMDVIAARRGTELEDDSSTVLMRLSGIYEDARLAEANNDDINAALWTYLTF